MRSLSRFFIFLGIAMSFANLALANTLKQNFDNLGSPNPDLRDDARDELSKIELSEIPELVGLARSSASGGRWGVVVSQVSNLWTRARGIDSLAWKGQMATLRAGLTDADIVFFAEGVSSLDYTIRFNSTHFLIMLKDPRAEAPMVKLINSADTPLVIKNDAVLVLGQIYRLLLEAK